MLVLASARRRPTLGSRPPSPACCSQCGFDQQLDANGIAGEDAATIQQNWEPHPERPAIDVAGCKESGSAPTATPGHQ
jgi:hypothetical protein